MKLTGKCKTEFDAYLNGYSHVLSVESFYALPYSMLWGVYVDFFDSEGILLVIGPKWDFSGYLALIERADKATIYANEANEGFIPFKTISEARTAALKKANELFNQLTK